MVRQAVLASQGKSFGTQDSTLECQTSLSNQKFAVSDERINMQRADYISVEKAAVDAIHLYRNWNPPPQDDGLILYNMVLGKGKSAKWTIDNPGIHFRKVPCAEL